MKVIMFILSLFVFLCSIVMLYGAAVNDSPMYATGIIIMLIICGLSFIMARICYKELGH